MVARSAILKKSAKNEFFGNNFFLMHRKPKIGSFKIPEDNSLQISEELLEQDPSLSWLEWVQP